MLSKPHAYSNLNYFVQAQYSQCLPTAQMSTDEILLREKPRMFSAASVTIFHIIQFLITCPSLQCNAGMQRRCFINPIEIQSKDLTIRQKVFECTNVPAKSEKTHSNQDPRPNQPTLRPFQSLNTKVIKWILLRNSVRNKSNCTFTSQWLWIVSIVDWISQGNYNLICWIWCPFCPFQNASGL